MSLKDSINDDLKNAMRARDKQTIETLRLVMSAIKQIEVDERITLDDERVITLLGKLTKQRKESISHFQNANRDDLVAKEEFELQLISKYLPKPLSEDEVTNIVTQAIKDVSATKMQDMGKVMTHVKPLLQGRADMSKVSALIKLKLTN